ncbi:unnamed protein product [Arctogadus glacialis]
MLQQRKAYANVKKIQKGEGIRFQTPLNKMRIHWASGTMTYSSAEEAVGDMRRKGHEVDDITHTRGATAHDRFQSRGLVPWTRVGRERDRTSQAGTRAKGRLQEFQREDNNAR